MKAVRSAAAENKNWKSQLNTFLESETHFTQQQTKLQQNAFLEASYAFRTCQEYQSHQ